jgi:hypothetical protein
MSIDAYRKAIATQGLLAYATAPKPEGKPLTEQQRQEAMRELYVANHLRRLDEEPELAAALKKKQKKKTGPNKWGLLQKAVLIVEVESRLPKKGKGLSPPDASITSVCKTLSREAHWERFLGKPGDGAATLRKKYSGCRADRKLREIALDVMEMDPPRRESFVRNVLSPLEVQQSGGHRLQQVMLKSRSVVSNCSD